MPRHFLIGSERRPVRDAVLVGPANPAERMEVSVLLRRNAAAALQDRVERLNKGDYSLAPLTRDAYAATHGAGADDIAAVKNFATAHRLTVLEASAARRTIILSGAVADFEAAFGARLMNYSHVAGVYRGREGSLSLPDELKNIVEAVLGLDNRPQARPHFRRLSPDAAAAAPAAQVSYSPIAIAALYGFPPGTGAGQTIGIVELGGGSNSADLDIYFKSLGVAAPKLVSVSVDNAANQATGGADGPDGEVMLDIEVAGTIAPGATLAVYFAPNTDAGFLDAITTAIHDTANKPSVISISWGSAESNWTAQAFTAFDQAFQDAAALGITICVASGDNGSSDTVNDGGNHVNFPASSPHVLACGGTSLQTNGDAIANETVWNDVPAGGASGGGISVAFPTLPAWQTGLSAALTAGGAAQLYGRGVPDVAGDADPQTGYQVRVDGNNEVFGGTSAVAPLWAGLIARLNASRTTPVGFVNPILYASPGAFNDIISGNNGAFSASSGWDACTGVGSPIGASIGALFLDSSPAAVPYAVKDDAFMVRGNSVASSGNILVKGKVLGVEPVDPWPTPGKLR